MSDREESSRSIADKLARLAELERDFERTLEVEKIEAMAEFAAGAGHEINNPLTVISGRAQLLLREEADPERRHDLALIVAQAMRAHEMIADMMLFARPPRPEPQSVDLVDLIDRVVAELLPRCQRQGTAICRVGSPGPIVVQADPVQLNVALGAIGRNAFEALQSGGAIEIGAEVEPFEVAQGAVLPSQPCLPPWVVISIRDNGPGLTPEERRHVFDPFYSARQAGRGMGIGLSKAWRIVTSHGGRIEVASQPGHGAIFTVILPR